MPIIDLPPNRSAWEVALFVASQMLHPDSREEAFARFAKHWLLYQESFRTAADDEFVHLPASWIKSLVAGKSLEELEQDEPLKLRQGFTAGATLLSMYVTSELGKKPTFNRAAVLVQRWKMATAHDPLDLFPDKPAISRAWKSMRSVAHLYAAQILSPSLNLRGLHLVRDHEALAHSLRLSGGLLDWASRQPLKSDTTMGTVLSPEEAWRLAPSDFPPLAPAPLISEQLPAWMRQSVLGYTNR